MKKLKKTEKLLKVVHDLRTQCPWDKKQTHQSLAKYFLEEAYEAVEAIHSKDKEALKEELGDVLLQVALHAFKRGAQNRLSANLSQPGVPKSGDR